MEINIELQGVKEALKMLDPKTVEKAAVRALNLTVNSGRAEASKSIRDRFNLKAYRVNQQLKVTQKASYGRLEAVITGRGLGSALSWYEARQTRKGVTVRVRKSGGRKLLSEQWGNKPFIATMRSGHVGVWVRGRTKTGGLTSSEKGMYGEHGKRYRKGKVREPLIQLFGPGVGGTFGTRTAIERTKSHIETRFPIEFQRQLAWYSSRAK